MIISIKNSFISLTNTLWASHLHQSERYRGVDVSHPHNYVARNLGIFNFFVETRECKMSTMLFKIMYERSSFSYKMITASLNGQVCNYDCRSSQVRGANYCHATSFFCVMDNAKRELLWFKNAITRSNRYVSWSKSPVFYVIRFLLFTLLNLFYTISICFPFSY